MFRDLTPANQEQGRKKFFALAGEIWRGAPSPDEQAYRFCDEILGFDKAKGRVSLGASTASQVQDAIKALEAEQRESLKRAAISGAKN